MRSHRQQGAVLVVSLVMLVVLTLFVLSSTRIATGNLRIVGNYQARQNVESIGQSVLEQVLSGIAPFYGSTAAVAWNSKSLLTGTPVTVASGIQVTLGTRTCIRATPATGYSAVSGISPEDTFWDVPVTVTDTIANTTRTLNQGVRIRLPAGNCL